MVIAIDGTLAAMEDRSSFHSAATACSAQMPADVSSGPPSLLLGGVQVPYSIISLVTLTVQNSALTILLHYSRTAPDAKPYSAAAAVLLNEILKGSISLVVALGNVDTLPLDSAAHARFPSDKVLSGQRRALSLSANTRRHNSTGLGSEESWRRKSGTSAVKPRLRAWYLDPQQLIHRLRTVLGAVLSPDCWKLGVPACCYVLQNNLQFVAASNLDVATFQVTYQMKILTTAFFSVTMLRKRLSFTKWACLVALALGVAIVQLANTATTTAKSSSHGQMDPLKGFLAVSMACMTSGFAGVYFEKVLKGSTADLWVRNVQLTLFSLPPAVVPIMFPDFSLATFYSGATKIKIPDPNAPTWLFGNFGGWAFSVVLCQVFGGLVTALVIRYSDNIAKGFATSLSILISFLAGVFLFNFPVTLPFLIGCSIVLAATWYYNQPEGESHSKSRPPHLHLAAANGASSHGPSHAYTIDVGQPPHSLALHRKPLSVDQSGDEGYSFADYKVLPPTGQSLPQFSNLSPFDSPQVQTIPSDEPVSPKSPIPPYIEGSPFGPPYTSPNGSLSSTYKQS